MNEWMGAIFESDIKFIIHHQIHHYGSQGQSKLYVPFILSINLQFLLPEQHNRILIKTIQVTDANHNLPKP